MASKFQTKLIHLYKKNGYKVINLIRAGANGYPDLIALKDGKTIWIESKELKDPFKELQKFRIDELIKNGFEAGAVRATKGLIYGNLKLWTQ